MMTLRHRVLVVTYTVSSGTLNSTIPYKNSWIDFELSRSEVKVTRLESVSLPTHKALPHLFTFARWRGDHVAGHEA